MNGNKDSDFFALTSSIFALQTEQYTFVLANEGEKPHKPPPP